MEDSGGPSKYPVSITRSLLKTDASRYLAMPKALSEVLLTMGVQRKQVVEISMEGGGSAGGSGGGRRRLWPVNVFQRQSCVALGGGWFKFLNDNKLKIGSKLLLTWEGPHAIRVRRIGRGRPRGSTSAKAREAAAAAAIAPKRKAAPADSGGGPTAARVAHDTADEHYITERVSDDERRSSGMAQQLMMKSNVIFHIKLQARHLMRKPLSTRSQIVPVPWDFTIKGAVLMLKQDSWMVDIKCNCNKTWFTIVTIKDNMLIMKDMAQFCKHHNVSEDDICIFEGGNSTNREIHVCLYKQGLAKPICPI